MATLSGWLSHPAAPPSASNAKSPTTHSPPLTDRGSTFVAHAASCFSPVQATDFQSVVRATLETDSHPTAADHEMMGWRSLVLRSGKTGLGEEGDKDWIIKAGEDDDGEARGGATIRALLEERGEIDVVVIVSRWYGGIMLGPARFDHMRKVAGQALDLLAEALALPLLLDSLRELDEEMESLLADEASGDASASDGKGKEKEKEKEKKDEYDGMKKDKIERLIKAREMRVQFLKKKMDKEREWMEEVQAIVKSGNGRGTESARGGVVVESGNLGKRKEREDDGDTARDGDTLGD